MTTSGANLEPVAIPWQSMAARGSSAVALSRSTVAVVVLFQCATLMMVCLLIGDNGWDDGAITLAYARTFARHGRVALTHQSEIVEGFSSVSWFLLNSLIARVRPSFRLAITVAQALSVVSIASCTVLLARTCALVRLDKLFSLLTLIAFAACGCSFSEAGNAMEMGLLGAACLVIVNELLSSRPSLLLLCGGVVLAVTTRWEAILYVGLLGLSVVSVPGRRAFWAIILTAAVSVALLSAWRLAVFSDIVPNTVWAKRWPPYAAFSVGDRFAGGMELPSLFLVPLLALGTARPFRLTVLATLRTRSQSLAIVAAPVVGAVLMGSLMGRHWGYYGRMQYFASPPALLLLSFLLSRWVAAERSGYRLMIAACALASAVGISMVVGFPVASLRAAYRGGAFSVSPHTYAESGDVFRRFAAAADLAHASILTPDVGGLALCCDELKIVDLALLSNRKLAQEGLAAIPQVLAAERPDLAEVHWKWTVVSKLYELPAFRQQYAPAFGGATRVWIRRDLAERIERSGRGCWLPLRREDVSRAVQDDRYATTELSYDRSSFERLGVVFALDQEEPGHVNLCRRSTQGTTESGGDTDQRARRIVQCDERRADRATAAAR